MFITASNGVGFVAYWFEPNVMLLHFSTANMLCFLATFSIVRICWIQMFQHRFCKFYF